MPENTAYLGGVRLKNTEYVPVPHVFFIKILGLDMKIFKFPLWTSVNFIGTNNAHSDE